MCVYGGGLGAWLWDPSPKKGIPLFFTPDTCSLKVILPTIVRELCFDFTCLACCRLQCGIFYCGIVLAYQAFEFWSILTFFVLLDQGSSTYILFYFLHTLFLFGFFKMYFMCIGALPESLSMHYMHAMASEARRRCQITWDWR